VFQLGQLDDQVGQRQQVLELLWRSTGGQQIARGYSVSSPTRRSSESPTRVGAASQLRAPRPVQLRMALPTLTSGCFSDQDLEQSVEEGKQRGQASARR